MPSRCKEDGCYKSVSARGWCSMHYKRWRLHGDVNHQPVLVVARLCSVDSCRNPHFGHGYCSTHLRRVRLYGDPLGSAPTASTPWMDDEIEILRRTVHLTAKDVARQLGRTESSVKTMRHQLSQDEGIVYLRGAAYNPHFVGSRRLLAKTCLGCGLLLPADWYTLRGSGGGLKRGWTDRCTRCFGKSTKPRPSEAGKPPSRSRQELQRITRERAHRHGQPWLDADHSILRDSTLTIFEKAIKLGRTYESTTAACSCNGYTSRVGKGDPMQGAWHIDNPNEPSKEQAA